MRERAALLGGRLEAEAHAGLFRLYAWLPDDHRAEETSADVANGAAV
jgi:hypothetical protein